MTVGWVRCSCGLAYERDGEGNPGQCPNCGASPSAEAGSATVRIEPPSSSGGEPLTNGRFAPGARVGRYEIVRRIGRGATGSVFEAVGVDDGSRVALKILNPERLADEEFVRRFEREARILSRLRHDRIARVHEFGTVDGFPYLAMELVLGEDLETILERDGPLDPARAARWMREAAEGLDAAARRGVIHRDVKPTNLLVDESGSIRIVDFGLARIQGSDSRVTATGTILGTPYYLAPEQAADGRVDERADIYSLGATFYHLLSGRPPFEGESSVRVIYAHVHEPLVPLSRRAKGVPEALARIVCKCLAKDPDDRYQDGAELAEDLEAFEKGDPVSAPPEEEGQRRARETLVLKRDAAGADGRFTFAGPVRRAFALGFDVFVAWLLFQLAGPFVRRADPSVVSFLLTWGYFAIGDALGGRTLGKRMFRLAVRTPQGGRIGVARAVARALLLAPLAAAVAQTTFGTSLPAWWERAAGGQARTLVLLLAGLDLLFALLEPHARTLHDLASGTAVLRVRRRRRRPRRIAREEGSAAPWVCALGSLFVPGLGQWLNGEPLKAAILFGGTFVGWALGGIPGFIVWGYSVLEAYHQAASERRR